MLCSAHHPTSVYALSYMPSVYALPLGGAASHCWAKSCQTPSCQMRLGQVDLSCDTSEFNHVVWSELSTFPISARTTTAITFHIDVDVEGYWQWSILTQCTVEEGDQQLTCTSAQLLIFGWMALIKAFSLKNPQWSQINIFHCFSIDQQPDAFQP